MYLPVNCFAAYKMVPSPPRVTAKSILRFCSSLDWSNSFISVESMYTSLVGSICLICSRSHFSTQIATFFSCCLETMNLQKFIRSKPYFIMVRKLAKTSSSQGLMKKTTEGFSTCWKLLVLLFFRIGAFTQLIDEFNKL